jgi:hemerythrin superfamily protein
MNAIEMLTRQHREMEGAFEALMSETPEGRGKLFERVADTLMSHILVEERHFYPAVNAKKTEDILLESLEEHLSLKRVLADLVALSPDDPHFEPKLHVLKEQSEHHHKEEEEHLFPKVKKLLARDELEALGEQMRAAQSELLAESPRNQVAEQTDAASEIPGLATRDEATP